MYVDFHSHIYPCFDLNLSLQSILDYNAAIKKVAFLTERSDCHFFNSLDKHCSSASALNAEIKQGNLIVINNNLNIFSGRQFVSNDSIEILSIFCAPQLADKKDSESYCTAILEAGGLIAFSWAFGKWIGSRGEKIYELSKKYGKSNVIILDSRLRPGLFKLPAAMSELKSQGFKFLAGSDPLPLKHHQKNILSFGNVFTDTSDNIEQSIRSQITNNTEFETFGSHCNLFDFAKDQLLLRCI